MPGLPPNPDPDIGHFQAALCALRNLAVAAGFVECTTLLFRVKRGPPENWHCAFSGLLPGFSGENRDVLTRRDMLCRLSGHTGINQHSKSQVVLLVDKQPAPKFPAKATGSPPLPGAHLAVHGLLQ